ncbi:uncharacterized protein [Asterias amurensis]|uniref:uncharacterized protein n=1 Tax=Asterias amurensis TaxID=7602 RepID=UPI003AB26FE9
MMYSNAFGLESATTSTWINRQHNNIETRDGSQSLEDSIFGSYLPIPTSNTFTDTVVSSRTSQAPLPYRPPSSGLVLGSTSSQSHVPVEHCNNMLYHSMTPSPMMPPQQLNYPYVESAAKKFMTPLHVITSMSNDHLPFYSYPQGDSNKGVGLLKIATKSGVKSTGWVTPPASASSRYQQTHGQCSNVATETSSFSGVIRPTWRPVCQPTMAVAPITHIGLGDGRIITKRPAPPERNLPQLKKRKLRTTFRKEQVEYMEKYFKISMYLNILDRKELAVQLGLEETQVKTWFQNRRMRWKRQRPGEIFPPAAKTVRVMRTSQCPPAATQGQFPVPTPPLSNVSTPPAAPVMAMPRQFVVPTPPPSNLTTPTVVTGTAGQSEGLPWYPMLAPSTIYSQPPTSTVPTESCCPAQTVYGTPVFPHFPAGLGIHPWTSTNTIGPHGGVQYPPRHV